ncbi:hypothetical protein HF313_07015 [Massilia atriviolacea]|uniref:Uncharacterized protein n=1 Tax=Massilia atriviolacea TaxID=2495579 RepID=A0A430HM02_9BURK|nr:hypothetical protein [Massilia atriviolacea]RSZ58504.1 hypothetical protein EJB06_12735 [Massilia atriviolacea]
MDPKVFQSLVEKAQADPAFFHQLIFTPETVIAQVSDLDRQAKGSLVGLDPAALIATAVGILQRCGNTCSSSCDNTCGGSCGYTTNLTAEVAVSTPAVTYFSRLNSALQRCGNTCSSSCDNTCGESCGYTTNFTDMGPVIANPAAWNR